MNAADTAETTWKTNEESACAEIPREERRSYDFGLQNSYKDADDLSISYDTSRESRPVPWYKFFQH